MIKKRPYKGWAVVQKLYALEWKGMPQELWNAHTHTLYIEAKAVPLHMESHGLERHRTKNKVPAVQQLGTHSSTESGVPYHPLAFRLESRRLNIFSLQTTVTAIQSRGIILTNSFPSYCPFSSCACLARF